MNLLIPKKELDSLMNIKGEARGIAIGAPKTFIISKQGTQGLKKATKELKKLGLPTPENLEPTQWYPVGTIIATSLVYQRLFNWNEKDFEEMGKAQVQLPLVARLFMKYFISLDKIKESVQRVWSGYLSIGKAEIIKMEIGKKSSRVVERITGVSLHPLQCAALRGYFSAMATIVVGKEVSVKEIKCTHRGNKYHEFTYKW